MPGRIRRMQRSTTPLWQYSATELAQQIAAREISASEVTAAHIRRIEQVNPSLNAVVFPLFEEAMETAKRIDNDRQFAERGILRGVPMTIKECFRVAGARTTLGMTTPSPPHAHDGPLVARLRKAGAVFLGLTNVPQLMIIHETRNPVYGSTHNPWNRSRTVGGSSGGEAAILAAGGSALGLGSDLGGSIRMPAHFCGIAGLKPTSRRLVRSGVVENLRGMSWLEFQPGPMARHVADLRLGMQALARRDPPSTWEAAEDPPLGFPEDVPVDISQLRVGVYADDGFFTPCPAVGRAIREGAEGLKARGATIVELEPPQTLAALESYFGIASADGGKDFQRLLRGSKRDPEVARLVKLAGLPRRLRPLLAAVMLNPLGKRKMAEIFQASGPRSANELWQVTWQAVQQIGEIFRTWDNAQVDVVLCPVHATPALLPGTSVDLLPAASYSVLMNLLGVPCGTVSATRVRASEETDRDSKHDASYRLAKRIETGSQGLPVGVQVAGRLWREDQVLATMEALEEHFRGEPDYPDITQLPSFE